MSENIVYTHIKIPDCSFCTKAKELLDKGIDNWIERQGKKDKGRTDITDLKKKYDGDVNDSSGGNT